MDIARRKEARGVARAIERINVVDEGLNIFPGRINSLRDVPEFR